ncbi:helix-turn-helix transcriptional regulator [Bordetella holmesii]|uniref:DNA-binding helix-turn-helix protein n=2 Tax=Bordetella holmesii TaxID=35814 RepID=A0A158M134_9BORD|nr:helix-turn-helix transcriptional regulator [Bordetella holmesii]AHV94544.1 bacterial regulatory helix-turn-helix s, AraC family protein [Bordetella holmesii ATCC 51541]AIT27933.1 bacterial regulatory helix-turn-helix s, AraC family protein [Bordetella holmesii 44057]EWM40711.1 bacterial regulatory helix-turn-helix s, AraC family protein [Bordetella holmesii 35009]EWM42581.1 bacterial regulatory helix-turn-helix s, AraC family protein [Bordetella holmesii 41130]EWM44608.1 bacterial regulator
MTSRSKSVRTYGMRERSDRLDFYIRTQDARPALEDMHRHDYFQIQINLGGDTVQQIGGTTRPFVKGMMAFILPHRLHRIPHPPDGRFMVINVSQEFLLPGLQCDPLDLEDVPLSQAPELAPFRFQESLDFSVSAEELPELESLLARMLHVDRERGFGSAAVLRGGLLQLIGQTCMRHASALQAGLPRQGRRQALARVSAHIEARLDQADLSLNSAAAAAFLSPSHLAHLLRKTLDRSFTEWVLERRMTRAKALLLTSDKRITEVAHACGFADEAYFSRRFRQSVGMSPRQFRQQ